MLDAAVAACRLAVRETLREAAPGDTVLVAVSGGADSMALLAATIVEARTEALRVVGVTVDHGLQEGSAARASDLVTRMAAMGADETITATVNVDAAGIGPEAAARQARYAVLDEIAERTGAALILVGHTMDDQAETVLLGLTHGSGARSLSGMRRGYGRYRRPLLDVRRRTTLEACAAEGIEVWHDPHNDDPGFTRVRIRQTILPVLTEHLGPGVTETLARTADQLRADADLLDDIAEGTLASMKDLDVETLAAMPAALRTRVLRLGILGAGVPAGELTHAHITEVDRLVTDWHGQRWIDLPGHLRAVREQPHGQRGERSDEAAVVRISPAT
jgi:tRNA(Ile)-lysidine synthase